MKYRVEYREDGWGRAPQSFAEGQCIRQALSDGRRLTVLLMRFPGTTGPGKVTSARLEALLEERWGRRRWHPSQELHSRDVELVEASG